MRSAVYIVSHFLFQWNVKLPHSLNTEMHHGSIHNNVLVQDFENKQLFSFI